MPGRYPEHTYNSRSDHQLEQKLLEYVRERGSILTLVGPTKTGKTVLLERVIDNPIWVDGQGLDDLDTFWSIIGDELSLHVQIGVEKEKNTAATAVARVSGGLPFLVNAEGGGDFTAGSSELTQTVTVRSLAAGVKKALLASGRTLVVDDFHFITRPVQTEIVRAVKPLVYKGLPAIFTAISHRVNDSTSVVEDMIGRVDPFEIELWDVDELLVIAAKGFPLLNAVDEDFSIAKRLAQMSFGSPHIMQRLCRELCKVNDLHETSPISKRLQPPPDWDLFFTAHVDATMGSWFKRLLSGPEEGSKKRTSWTLKNGVIVDGYGLVLAALAATGPKLSLSKEEVGRSVGEVLEGTAAPAPHQNTRVLLQMSRIALTRLSEPAPTEEELDGDDGTLAGGVQPVLEYVEDGPNSVLHIADPFFAYYLRWGSARHLA